MKIQFAGHAAGADSVVSATSRSASR
ncbi:hypothetical protein [Streptomyces prunicolor]